jgi:predicted dehydrogenase
MHTLLILDPGHFHAALVLRESHPELSDEIHVYAADGPDLERFRQMAESFNQRKVRPTRWRIRLETGTNSRDRLLREKAGDVVVLAGQNHTKMETIAALHRAGFHVLADKPWVITDTALPLLHATMQTPRPLAADIMT